MASSPLVSVLVPVYNHGQYVEDCLNSIADQDYGPVELVVIDDGSSDDSAARVEAWIATHRERFARVSFETQPNAGVVATLNRLVGKAEGAFLVPIASDDALLPGALRLRVGLLDSDPDALALLTDCTVIDGAGRRVHDSGIERLYQGDPGVLRRSRFLLPSLLLRWCVPGPVLTLRREALDPAVGVGPFDENHFPEDLDFYLRLARTGRLRFSPEQTAAYRLHGTNSIATARARLMAGTRSILSTQAPGFPLYSRLIARMYVAVMDGAERPWRRRRASQLASSAALKLLRPMHERVVRWLPDPRP